MTLPTSRWRPGARSDPSAATKGAADRVRLAQRQALWALGQSAAFAAAAAVAAVVPHDSGRWLPLHLFLAGALTSAISGATVLFTVTWSAAPAPAAPVLAVQRALVGVGTVGLVSARVGDWPPAAFAAAGVAYMTGLLVLGVVLVRTVRRGVERRFDVPAAWYLAAVAFGLVASGVGAAVGTGHGNVELRAAHVAVNLLGLVGLVLGGTLPTFAATMARTRTASRATPRRHAGHLGWQAVAVAVTGLGASVDHRVTTAVGLAMYAVGVAAGVVLLPPPKRKHVQWAGPRLVGLWAGIAWWVAAVASAAVGVTGGDPPFGGRGLGVLVVAGYGQILWASFAYLVPVATGGGHERLGRNFAATRSWPGLAAANLTGVALAVDAAPVALAAGAVWAADTAVRAARITRRR